MGPVAQLVFKTSAVVQPTARSVRLRRRSVKGRFSVLRSPAMSADEGLAKVEEAQAQLRAILFPDEHGGGMRDDLGQPLGLQLLEVHRLLGEAVERLRT
jgi:hypothetical protein